MSTYDDYGDHSGSSRRLPPINDDHYERSRNSNRQSKEQPYPMRNLDRHKHKVRIEDLNAGYQSDERDERYVNHRKSNKLLRATQYDRSQSPPNHTNSYTNRSFHDDTDDNDERQRSSRKFANIGYTESRVLPLMSQTIDNEKSNNLSNDYNRRLNSTKQFNSEENIRKKATMNDNNDSDFTDDDDDDEMSVYNENANTFQKVRFFVFSIFRHRLFKTVLLVLALIAYPVYFGFAMKLNNPFAYLSNLNNTNGTNVLDEYIFSSNRGLALLVLTIIVFLVALWDNIIRKYLPKPTFDFVPAFVKKHFSKFIVSLVFIGIVAYITTEIISKNLDLYNLVSLSGIGTFILICIAISNNPFKINWHILFAGLEIQFIIGVLLTRIDFGYRLFKFVGDQVTAFLDYTDTGARFVFGDNFLDHFFAFKAMAVVIFFGAMINLFYYLGVVQYLILKLAWLVNSLMGTSPTESMNATANIFLGQTEAPLLIKPFLRKMTTSEIFSVMVGGFATVAGAVLAAYIRYNVPANHLIIASLMAAPGALVVSKTIYPETKKTKANWDAIRNLPKGEEKNMFEAISRGASNMVGPVAGIVSNLIAFMAFFAFINAIVAWFFSMLNVEDFGLTSIMEYLFWPFAFLMGIKSEDCNAIARLVGIKIFVNEFAAYSELGKAIDFKKNITLAQTFDLYYNKTLPVPSDINMIWNDRSILISTYALCGFANLASVGIQIGGMTALEPKRFKAFAKLAFKAMIAGNITNFITACISGLLFTRL